MEGHINKKKGRGVTRDPGRRGEYKSSNVCGPLGGVGKKERL